jgi:hypothetical protein
MMYRRRSTYSPQLVQRWRLVSAYPCSMKLAHQHTLDRKTAPVTLAKLQDPFKKTLDAAQKDLKPIYSGLNKYGKALDKV